MDKISNGIEALGFGKWFHDNVDPKDLESFDVARVIAVHKDSYILNNGENDVFAELIGKMLFSASSPIDFPAVGDWVLASFYDKNILQVMNRKERPSKNAEKIAAAQAAQAKYYLAKLSNEISYEVQNAMGGMSLTDNLKVDRAFNVSKVQEVIGGTRNVMLLLMSGQISRDVKKTLTS